MKLMLGIIIGFSAASLFWLMDADIDRLRYERTRALADYYAHGAIYRGYVTSCRSNGKQGVWYKDDCDGASI